jgi:hypothetical protein
MSFERSLESMKKLKFRPKETVRVWLSLRFPSSDPVNIFLDTVL